MAIKIQGKSGRKGVLNNWGHRVGACSYNSSPIWVIPPKYNDILESHGNYIVSKGAHSGLMTLKSDSEAMVLLEPNYSEIKEIKHDYGSSLNTSFYLVSKQNGFWAKKRLYGIFDVSRQNGSWLVPLEFEKIEIVDEKYAILFKNGKHGLCIFNGKVFFDAEHKELKIEQLASYVNCFIVQNTYCKGLIYDSFTLPIENDDFEFITSQFIIFTKNSKKGLISYRGISRHILIDPIYSEIDIVEMQAIGPFHILLLKLDNSYAVSSNASILYHTSNSDECISLERFNEFCYKIRKLEEDHSQSWKMLDMLKQIWQEEN